MLPVAIGLLALLQACSGNAPRPAADPGRAGNAEPATRAERAPRQERAARTERPDRTRRESRDMREAAPAQAAAGGTVIPLVEVPEEAAIAFNRALALMTARDFINAEIELTDLAARFPGFAGPEVNLAIIYRQDGRIDDALGALQRALAIAPDHPSANNELGLIERGRGDFEAAEAAYRRAIAGDPDYALAHYNLGVLLDLYLRREAEALEQYEAYQALTAVPDDEVGRWVVDLRRRLGLSLETTQLAREEGL
jgi:tetratricopeptide (TPR) repeat protein